MSVPSPVLEPVLRVPVNRDLVPRDLDPVPLERDPEQLELDSKLPQ
jgi:hypothetical protein